MRVKSPANQISCGSGNKTPGQPVWIRNAPLLQEHDKLAGFEQSIMPHMDAAYNLARWLTTSDPDAQDVVQEAYLRAFKFFGGFRGGNSASPLWLPQGRALLPTK